MTVPAILAIDSGTSNSKAILVSRLGQITSTGTSPVQSQFPEVGWVEQSAQDIWTSAVDAISKCLADSSHRSVEAIGISNQRESVLAWNRNTGEPLGPVITWQCRRTAARCDELREAGHETTIVAKTGLPIDPLFPAAKIRWLMDQHCQDIDKRDICIGTVDVWLAWNLTSRTVHATDASNAARTQLYNVAEGKWDFELCDLFEVDPIVLPSVCDSSHIFGTTKGVSILPDGIPVASVIGDSHAALFSHAAFSAGDSKVTLGTGSSMMTTVEEFLLPPKGITTTIAWQLNGRPTYALEGNILVSASILPWTAKILGLKDVDSLLNLAGSVEDSLGVNLVPGHVGLGSPYWNARVQGLVDGLTFGATPAHIAHAAVRSIALQICDVFDAINAKSPTGVGTLSVDGGPSRNLFITQMLTDMLDHSAKVRENPAASAIGAAFLAGLAVELWPSQDSIASLVKEGRTLLPNLDESKRSRLRDSWHRAVARTVHLA